MSSSPTNPAAPRSRGNGIPRVIVATTALLTFISFWRAAAIVLNDLASSAYYAGGEAEGFVGKTAPWFILADHDFLVLPFARCTSKAAACSSAAAFIARSKVAGRHARQIQRVGADVRLHSHRPDQRRRGGAISRRTDQRTVRSLRVTDRFPEQPAPSRRLSPSSSRFISGGKTPRAFPNRAKKRCTS